MVTSSLTLAKDLTKSAAEAAIDKELSKLMYTLISNYSKILDQTLSRIFNGEMSSTQWLYRMLQDGKMISSIDKNLSTEEIKELIKRPVYTQLIPRAWRLSNLPVGPFMYDTKVDCNNDGSLKNSGDEKKLNIASSDMIRENGVCHEGKLYILASAPDPGKYCSNTGDTSDSCFEPFQNLPGSDDMKSDKWGKLRMKDIAQAAINTWKANGKKNSGNLINLDDEFSNIDINNYGDTDSNDIVDKVLDAGITVPGLVYLPVCDTYEAVRGWESGANTVGGASRFNAWDNYPCD